MTEFAIKPLPPTRDVVALDGSDVRILLGLRGGGMAHFTLAPGQTSGAVAHRTVEEIWYVLSGRGEMWRKDHQDEEIVTLGPEPLAAVAVTMPPWPDDHEAYPVDGPWHAA